jgi:hypothetical protein
MTTKSGKLRNNEAFADMIENLGDAYEAAGECYGMIWYLAAMMATDLNWTELTGPPSRAQVLGVIAEAEAHYQDGLRLGGVQRDR